MVFRAGADIGESVEGVYGRFGSAERAMANDAGEVIGVLVADRIKAGERWCSESQVVFRR